MNFDDKLKELKAYDLNCNVFDVYSYNGLSMQELLCQFFTKINECVVKSNTTLDFVEWLVNDGLKKEVAEKLFLWYNDGTLENIINVTLFENLNKELNSRKNKYMTEDGEIILPNNFPKLPFKVFKNGNTYSTNINAIDCIDINNVIQIYVSKHTNDGDGIDRKKPISLTRFFYNLENGVYNGYKNFVVNMVDSVIYDEGVTTFINGDYNILIKSTSPTGFTWFGRIQNEQKYMNSWTKYQGTVWKNTQTKKDYLINQVINISSKCFETFIKVDTLTECLNKTYTFYQDGYDIYVNYPNNDAKHLCTVADTTNLYINSSNKSKIIFENINFPTHTLRINPNNLDAELYFFNCLFTSNPNDSISFNGKYKAYLINCKCYNGQKDGFNYHSDSTESLAVEVGCEAYNSGVYKPYAIGNTTTHSNNGSTAHDGMYVARFGCKYSNCQGPIVADVNGCYSINYGVSAIGIADGNTGYKSSFLFEGGNKAILYDCIGGGKNVDYGVFISDNITHCEVYNFKGKEVYSNNIKILDGVAFNEKN